ncbi:extracellular solute-binding protein [Virgibacillus halophilus]|uniref:Extracellular solute-binding protein n=1 Tax=Tigheibacillus halophilus TaxID=361280 RepID=A0ABU5C3R7_9BACI|nr:extracellular solute-binding protein [Virgibacillus halophilus]
MRKVFGGFILFIAFMFVLAGCSNDNKDASGSADSSGKEEITFWHAMSGDNGKALENIVDKFNKQSDDVHVKAIYQGSYDDSLSKLRAVGGSKEAPALVQVFEIGTKYMSGSGFITPMQEFIDKEKFDTSHLESNILSYYTLDDKLYSMPFNTSNAVMFYNKDKFKKSRTGSGKPAKNLQRDEGCCKEIGN